MSVKESTGHGVPEEFSAVPLITLVPSIGSVTKLDGATSALFARYQKIKLLVQEVENADPNQVITRFIRERDMLREVLEWLAVNLEEDL